MQWIIESVQDGSRMPGRRFESFREAQNMIRRIAPGLTDQFRAMPADPGQLSSETVKMLREGMVKGDLRGILLPMLSVDQYMPADPKTDNVVIAFYIKGVPEAVLPVKNYIDHCDGVIDVDYGDSETIPNCSIVYAEMSRNKLNTEYIHTMVRDMARLAQIEADDFTVTFPTSDDKFQYRPEILDQYFRLRTEEANQKAQDEISAAETQSDGVDPNSSGNQISNESELLRRMVALFG